MVNPYRRLGVLCRIAHIAYGFLTAHAAAIHPLMAAFMFISFVVYEFAEWIHDVIRGYPPRLQDFPDDELAELGIGMALYVLTRLIQSML